MPDTYKGYIVNVEKISQTKTRILFKNVPIDCPEIELVNLCNTYGKIEGRETKENIQKEILLLRRAQWADQ